MNTYKGHIHVGTASLCKQASMLCPARDYIHCKVCAGISHSNNYKKIKIENARFEIQRRKFLKKYRISPIDALVNYITFENQSNLDSLSSSDFDGISPDCVLARAIMDGKICFADGVLHPIIPEATS